MKGKKPTLKKSSSFLVRLIPYVIAIASVIAAITPSNSDDKIVRAINDIASVLSLSTANTVVVYEDVCKNPQHKL